jgi:predicted esterase
VVRKLEENLGGALTVKVYDGVGHEFTQEMKEDFRRWLVELLNTREEN